MMNGEYFEKSESEYKYPALILVEGTDDAYFFDALLADLKVPKKEVRIVIANGKDRLATKLGLILKSHEFDNGTIRKYLVVRDADNDHAASYRDLKRELSSLNEPVAKAGEMVKRSDGRIAGIYFFPKPDENGDLETLMLDSINSDPLLDHTKAFIYSSNSIGGKTDHNNKRIWQAYLSVSSFPLCAGPAYAMKKGMFHYNISAFEDIKVFVKKFLSAN